MYSLLIRDGNGVYKLITNDNDKVLWFEWIQLWEDGDIEVQIDDDNFGYLIPVDKDKGIYRLEKKNEDSQQQNQPLNEIINRLVRNYLR